MSGISVVPEMADKGPPAERSDADLDRLAEVSPDDVESGAEYWEDNAPDGFEDLTEADVLPDEEGDP